MGLFSCNCDEYRQEIEEIRKEKDRYSDNYYMEMDRANNAERKHIGLMMRNESHMKELERVYTKLDQWAQDYEKKEIIWKKRYIDLEEKYRKLILDKVNEDEKKDRNSEASETS